MSAEEAFEEHPSREVVARFVRGEASPEEGREVVRHLLAGCSDCRLAVGADWDRAATGGGRPLAPNVLPFAARRAGAPGPRPEDYEPVFERVVRNLASREREFSAERRLAPALRGRLEAMTAAERRRAIVEDPEFRRWALIESLLEDSREQGVADAGRALELAELALAGVERLDAERYSAAALADLAARAWAQRGNALRIVGRLTEARDSLAEAIRHLARGSGDSAERCRVLMMAATLSATQKRYDEADLLLERSMRLARRSGDRHLQGSVLVRKARVAQRREDVEGALELLARGLPLIDLDRDPRLLLVAQHNSLQLLVESGQFREALDRVEETRTLHSLLGGRLDLLRFRWLEGRIYAGLGWLRHAATHFEDVRRGFIAEGMAYDVALVSLALAEVYAQEGRHREVRELAEQMLPIFRSREAHQEALAALLAFQEAARDEAASVHLIRQVADYLRRSRGNELPPFRLAPAAG
ncbi:MAG TPA: hypothetical protein VHM02_02815 [Thermoanaerobaculia bacterium]|nr:hypothetical protein [Thermoanaerobaculia bacterium]